MWCNHIKMIYIKSVPYRFLIITVSYTFLINFCAHSEIVQNDEEDNVK